MKKIKVNRKHYVHIDNIEKIVIKGRPKSNGGNDSNYVWVYRKVGYPKIYKTDYGFYMFKMRLTALGFFLTDFKVEYDND